MKKNYTFILIAFLCVCLSFPVSAQIINTIVGTGVPGYDGNGAALAKKIFLPFGVAVDASGNVYFSDNSNYIIRKVTPSGTMSTIGGIAGTFSYLGDEVPATTTAFHDAFQVAIDNSGNLYIADATNDLIRMIDPAGISHRIAGVPLVSGYTGDGGMATDATLSRPSGVAVDAAGNVYIGDYSNGAVRKVSTTGIITTLASGLGNVYEVAVDGAGNVYAALFLSGRRIAKIDPAGVVTTFLFISDPPAFPRPMTSVAVDKMGYVYAGDRSRVYRIDPTGTTVDTIAGTALGGYGGDGGPATSAQLSNVNGIAIGATGDVYISDGANNRIRSITYPIIPVLPITGTTTICQSATTTLTSATPGGSWSSSNPAIASVGLTTGIVTGNSGGTAIITYYTSFNFSTTPVTVIAPYTPGSAGRIYGLNYACPNTTVILSETIPGGTWSSSNTVAATISSSGIVTGITPGTSVISYSLSGSCGSTAVVKYPFKTLKYEDCTPAPSGIATGPTVNGPATIEAWPNPNEGTFTVKLSSGIEEQAHIVITNVLGEKVKEVTTLTNKSLDIKLDVANGMYFLNAVSEHKKWTQKVLVNASK